MEKRRPLNPNSDMELAALKEDLVNLSAGSRLQAETQKEILLILKGNVDAGMEGILQKFTVLLNDFNEMSGVVAHLIRFKKRIEESVQLEKQAEAAERERKRRWNDDRAKRVLNIVFGSIGTAVLIMEFVMHVIEQLSK